MTRHLITPSYYPSFKCKGSLCSENCCIGWEIDIDPLTEIRYGKAEGKIGEELRKNIVKDGEVSHFCLKDGRCPFLDGQNLCRLIIERGEELLCDICREHPRYYNRISSGAFAGVGLSCEAAAELILTEKEPLGFNLKNEATRKEAEELISSDTEGEDREIFALILDYLSEIEEMLVVEDSSRDACEKIIKSMVRLQSGIDEISYGVAADEEDAFSSLQEENSRQDINEAYGYLLSTLRSLDYLDGELLERISAVRVDQVSEFYAKNPSFLGYLKRCALYFADRYASGIFEDLDAVGRGNLIVLLTSVLCLLLTTVKEPTTECAVRCSTLLSRELEYNEDNAERLKEADPKMIIGLLW